MRHPLRKMATQGAWYAVGSALTKLSGFLLLPILTNTRYLSVADYGRWGIFEITAQLAVSILGLALPLGLVRFWAEEDPAERKPGERVVGAAWWVTVGVAVVAAILAGAGICLFASAATRWIYLTLLASILLELLLGVPQALFRAQERAGRYTGIFGLKLFLFVALALWMLAHRGMGLLGITSSMAVAGAVTLTAALFVGGRKEFIRPRIERETARRLLVFSVPLVIGGLGSMVLNAGDRYILLAFRGAEELAVYTLAGKFGGVVNMFVVQPFNLAWLPLLFRLEERQRPEVLRLLVPYLTLTLCLLVVGLCLFAGPVLRIMGSAAPYRGALPLMPWIGFGFVAFGLSLVFAGILALFQRTRTLSLWLTAAALLNVALNFLLIPRLGALAAALNTLIAYCVLLAGEYFSARRDLSVAYPWGRLCGITVLSLAVSWFGTRLAASGTWTDWLARFGLLAAWGLVLLAVRWLTPGEVREVWRVLRGNRA
jgi:O-antigen/teichoic acid export membrane protein